MAVYKLKNMGGTDFSDRYRKVIRHYKHIGYNLNAMQQSVCLVNNPIIFYNFCMPVDLMS